MTLAISKLDSAAMREKVVELVRSGMSEREVAEQLGFSRQTIQRAKAKRPDFRREVEQARMSASGEAQAVGAVQDIAKQARKRASRRKSPPRPASAVEPEQPREVVDGELVEGPPKRGCCPRCGSELDLLALAGDRIGDREELLQVLWADIRDRESIHHGRALDIGHKYYLTPDMLRARIEVERMLTEQGLEDANVVVIQIPGLVAGR